MIKHPPVPPISPELYGVILKVPAYSNEERARIQNMLDFPSEYTQEDFRQVLRETLQYLTKAEAFSVNLYRHIQFLKRIWLRWLSAIRGEKSEYNDLTKTN